MSAAEPGLVSVKILEKEYLVGCPEDERAGLMASADILNQQMQAIRASGKVIGVDRMAVMAALNLAHELIEQKARKPELPKSFATRIRALQDRVEAALNKGRQLEF